MTVESRPSGWKPRPPQDGLDEPREDPPADEARDPTDRPERPDWFDRPEWHDRAPPPADLAEPSQPREEPSVQADVTLPELPESAGPKSPLAKKQKL